MTENFSETAAQAAPAIQLYDAQAEQLIEYKKDGKTLGVVICGLPDKAVREYIKSVRQTQSQKGEDFVLDTEDEAALEGFFRSVAVRTVNIKLRDERELSDEPGWQDKFLSRFYSEAVAIAQRTLLMRYMDDEKETAEFEDVFYFDDADTKTYPVEIPFGNGWKSASFEMATPNAGQSKRFAEATKVKRYKKTTDGLTSIIDTPADELLRLYEETKVNVTGFASEPAANQKVMIVRRHFTSSVEIVEKK